MSSRGAPVTPRTMPQQPYVEPQAPASVSPSYKLYADDLRFLQTLRRRMSPNTPPPSAPTSSATTPRSANKHAHPQSAGPHARSRLSLISEHLRTASMGGGDGPAVYHAAAARSLDYGDSTTPSPPNIPHHSDMPPYIQDHVGMGSPTTGAVLAAPERPERSSAHRALETGRDTSAAAAPLKREISASPAGAYSTPTKSPPYGGGGSGARLQQPWWLVAAEHRREGLGGGGVPGDQVGQGSEI